jgi:hypothetical protein
MAVIPVLLTVVAIVNRPSVQPGPHTASNVAMYYVLWTSIIVMFIASISLLRQQFARKMYEPTLAIKYWDLWNGMGKERTKAATAINKYLECHDWEKVGNADDVEDVLDFLDDLGFLLHGWQTSDRVVHHYFYHWLVGYHQCLKEYVAQERSKPRQKSQWEYIGNAVEVIKEEGAAKEGCPLSLLEWNEKEVAEFVEDELSIGKDE